MKIGINEKQLILASTTAYLFSAIKVENRFPDLNTIIHWQYSITIKTTETRLQKWFVRTRWGGHDQIERDPFTFSDFLTELHNQHHYVNCVFVPTLVRVAHRLMEVELRIYIRMLCTERDECEIARVDWLDISCYKTLLLYKRKLLDNVKTIKTLSVVGTFLILYVTRLNYVKRDILNKKIRIVFIYWNISTALPRKPRCLTYIVVLYYFPTQKKISIKYLQKIVKNRKSWRRLSLP